MKLFNACLVSILALVLGISAAGCAQAAPVYASGAEKDQVVAAVAPFARDILDGMQQRSYALFTRDFDAKMIQNFSPDALDTMLNTFTAYGMYQSSELLNVEIVKGYYRVNYKLTYTGKVLTMMVAIPNNGTPIVTGLSFK